MKNFIKKLFVSLMMIILPLFATFFSGLAIRSYIGKPLYYAEGQSVRYAKVGSECYFFKTSNINDVSFRNVFYIVPETYFVIIVDDSTSPAIKVRYGDTLGYVSLDTIKEVSFVPVNPTLSGATLDISSASGTQIMSAPSVESEVECVISKNTRQIKYVAYTYGEVPSGGVSNVWYYAVFVPPYDPTSVFEGYIYSERVSNLSTILPNSEGIEETPPPSTDDEEMSESDANFAMNNTVKIILIVMICLPIILVFVLLLISNRKSKNDKLEKELGEELNGQAKSPAPKKKSRTTAKKKSSSKIRNLDDLDGQTLVRKPVFYTNFLDQKPSRSTANLEPEFPNYEVVDDDDLL